MAGNSNSGRHGKPVDQHILQGTFRADRHADPKAMAKMDGTPERPVGLGKDAAWLWDQVIGELASKRLVARIDTAHVWSMCELWGLYRAAVKRAKQRPLDTKIRLAVVGYKAAFDLAASKCGLNPVDRGKLGAPKEGAPKGPSVRDRSDTA